MSPPGSGPIPTASTRPGTSPILILPAWVSLRPGPTQSTNLASRCISGAAEARAARSASGSMATRGSSRPGGNANRGTWAGSHDGGPTTARRSSCDRLLNEASHASIAPSSARFTPSAAIARNSWSASPPPAAPIALGKASSMASRASSRSSMESLPGARRSVSARKLMKLRRAGTTSSRSSSVTMKPPETPRAGDSPSLRPAAGRKPGLVGLPLVQEGLDPADVVPSPVSLDHVS